jgi:hypothetical protein
MKLSNVADEAVYGKIEVVSFTGTRQGMTAAQKKSFRWLLKELGAGTLVHGDCVGADEDAGDIAHDLGMRVNKRPSTSETRAFSPIGTIVAKPKPPLERNPDIIDDGDCAVACPRGMGEERRSGTWAAVRYARKQDYIIWTVWPDGSLTWPFDPPNPDDSRGWRPPKRQKG